MPLPPFNNSAMDGYAFRSGDELAGELRIVAKIAAGDDVGLHPPLQAGQCARILTGAAIPCGADTVIMQEHVSRNGDKITVDRPVERGNAIRRLGEDAGIGDTLIAAGTKLGPKELGAIASIGCAGVEVVRPVRIALFCTGSELQQPGEPLASGQIYNSNRFILAAALTEPWIELVDLGTIKDDPQAIQNTLTQVADRVDMIVTTGGVSVGDADHMTDQLRAVGGELDVLRVAMKPGKPLTLGTLGRAVFVGLPGNPVAAFKTWMIFGRRIAERIGGQSSCNLHHEVVEVTESFTRKPGRQEFRPIAFVPGSSGGLRRVRMLDPSYSAKISMICRSDGFAIIPSEKNRIRRGDSLELVQF
jgi:molybdopterin molybdotransferase